MTAAVGWCLFDTAIGPCGLAWTAAAIAGAQLPETTAAATLARMRSRFPEALEGPLPPLVAPWVARIGQALAGSGDALLDLPLDEAGVPEFHRRVYAVARAIPPGQVLSYGELARQLGEPGAARAVGRALGLNPFAPIVPCHRILAAGGRSGGFSAAGGARTKLRLLEIEGAEWGTQARLFSKPG